MEIDSPTDSPPDSPVFTPNSVPALIANLSPSLLPQAVIAASDDEESMQLASIQTDDPPAPLLLDLVKPQSETLPADPIMDLQGSSSPELSSLDMSPHNQSPKHSILKTLPETSSHSIPLPVSTSSNLVTEDKEKVQEVKPKKKLVPNPFVSGGFVTEFVGELSQPEKLETNVQPKLEETPEVDLFLGHTRFHNIHAVFL
jgi:hypothetical protein